MLTFCNSKLQVNGSVSGLSAGLHGFHVHEKGDIGDACKDAGPHYNPFYMDHGGPIFLPRHTGDFGNIMASNSGIATINEIFAATSLLPPYSIIGRAIVVHAMRDDLGFGNGPTSKTTGESGERVACGIIGVEVTPSRKLP
ncbi:unnamed protein product [Toxocara canis]|uniref:Superoxide dismutase n=1 Tax=Toxocara canis TaxID=6265 RepID=A0A183V4G9_TOXCA|nr:unnamed protein product [Toxocara canis]